MLSHVCVNRSRIKMLSNIILWSHIGVSSILSSIFNPYPLLWEYGSLHHIFFFWHNTFYVYLCGATFVIYFIIETTCALVRFINIKML
jgi:high-affinity Fe2+/Pb2+ permease